MKTEKNEGTEIKKEEEGGREGIRAKKARKMRPQFLRPRDTKTRRSSGPEHPQQARPGSAQRRSVEHAAPPGPIHTGPGSPKAKQQSSLEQWPLGPYCN